MQYIDSVYDKRPRILSVVYDAKKRTMNSATIINKRPWEGLTMKKPFVTPDTSPEKPMAKIARLHCIKT